MRKGDTSWRALSIVCLLAAMAQGTAGGEYEPQPMRPTPPERLTLIGSAEGMALYPCEPVAGFPGMDPDPAKGRLPRNTPMLQNYPGSVEMYMLSNGYLPKVNPYNYRTLVRNFRAVDLPGVEAAREMFAAPEQYLKPGGGQWTDVTRTGRLHPPVPVVRLKPARGGAPGGPRLRFSFGPLPTSMYIVRVIGAIETANCLPYPRDLIVEMQINDGPGGAVNRYVLRHRGTDNFYPVGEFFFHVTDRRVFNVEIGLHPDSEIDLLVHNVDVHDVLGECAKRAGKTASLLAPPHVLASHWNTDPEARLRPVRAGRWAEIYGPEGVARRVAPLRAEFPGRTDDELLRIWRQRRDDAIWNNGVPLNVNLMGDEWGGLPIGVEANYSKVDPQTEAQLKAQGLLPLRYQLAQDLGPWRLIGKTPEGKDDVYTWEDLKAHKPYPGLPFAAPVWGKRFAIGADKAVFFSPLAQALGQSLWLPRIDVRAYVERGDLEAGRDLAIRLCRMAYFFPNLDPNRYFSKLVAPTCRTYQRWDRFYQYLDLPLPGEYDRLFTIIKDNHELAEAVGRYIPWVRTPQDVITLLDTYVLQYGAQQMAYWRRNWYDHGNAGRMAEVVALQMDPEITRPWVEFIFSRTWEYPFPPAGVQDYLYLSTQRDGTTAIGSFYYAQAGGVDVAAWLQHYVRNGGDSRYDLSDPRRFPRVIAGAYFPLEAWIAGMQHPGIGDVGGFYRPYAEWLPAKVAAYANEGWRWTRDPRFAWCLVHFGKRADETDAEWAEIQAAAKGIRNPFMSLRSRVLANWGGYLEGGTQADDFRFRHGARVRVGYGTGHSHADAMDLGIWSLGVPVSVCGGARGGYGYPSTGASLSHNVVTVDGKNWSGHAWIPDLADLETVQYLRARGNYLKEFSRQVALIELDQGRPARKPPSTPHLGPGTRYDPDVILPRAYVLDVFRVAGGSEHMYNFHGFPDDQFAANVERGQLSEAEQKFLAAYTVEPRDLHWGGTIADDHLMATWRLDRTGKAFVCPARPERTYYAHKAQGAREMVGAEPFMLGVAYDPNSPRKFLRVHLFGQRGARFLTGEAIIAPYGVGRTDGEYHRQAHVVRRAPEGQELASLFVALWEPYAGEPVIREARLEGNPDDAFGFAAVHLETVDGIRDLCFADHTPNEERTLADGTRVQAEFAYVSRDARGLRQACLVAGRFLRTPEVTIRSAAPRWEARVVAVDYAERRATLDASWPAKLLDGHFFEVGAPARGPHLARWTTFEAERVEPVGGQTRLRWRKGADVFSGVVTGIDTGQFAAATVVTTAFSPIVVAGEESQLVATTETGERAWRCDVTVKPDYKGQSAVGGRLTLYSDGVSAPELGGLKVGDRIRLYAFGVGDVWRAPTRVSLARVGDNLYRLRANTPCDLTMAGVAEWWVEAEAGQRVMQAAMAVQPPEGQLTLHLTERHLAAGAVYLRLRAKP